MEALQDSQRDLGTEILSVGGHGLECFSPLGIVGEMVAKKTELDGGFET